MWWVLGATLARAEPYVRAGFHVAIGVFAEPGDFVWQEPGWVETEGLNLSVVDRQQYARVWWEFGPGAQILLSTKPLDRFDTPLDARAFVASAAGLSLNQVELGARLTLGMSLSDLRRTHKSAAISVEFGLLPPGRSHQVLVSAHFERARIPNELGWGTAYSGIGVGITLRAATSAEVEPPGTQPAGGLPWIGGVSDRRERERQRELRDELGGLGEQHEQSQQLHGDGVPACSLPPPPDLDAPATRVDIRP